MNGKQYGKGGGGKPHHGPHGKGGSTQNKSGAVPMKEHTQRYIQEEKSAAEMIKACEGFGQYLKNNRVSTSQLRNAYGSMKKLEMTGWNKTTQRQLLLIKPRLAYAAGRHGAGMEDLSNVVGYGIDAVGESEENFKRFCQFFEAIVAYFKAAGGK